MIEHNKEVLRNIIGFWALPHFCKYEVTPKSMHISTHMISIKLIFITLGSNRSDLYVQIMRYCKEM